MSSLACHLLVWGNSKSLFGSKKKNVIAAIGEKFASTDISEFCIRKKYMIIAHKYTSRKGQIHRTMYVSMYCSHVR